MPRISELAALGLDALRETKRLMISSDDIIPSAEIPVLSWALYPIVMLKYGERGRVYTEFVTSDIRLVVRGGENLFRYGKDSRMITSVAMSKLGVGECEEHVFVAAHELLKHGYHDFYICKLNGVKPTDGLPGSECLSPGLFSHCIIVMNPPKSFKPCASVSQLEKLADDVIVLDPFLKYVGHANRYREDMKAYLGHYSIKSMESLCAFSKRDIEKVPEIERKASFHLKRFPGLSPYKVPEVFLMNRAFHVMIKEAPPSEELRTKAVQRYRVSKRPLLREPMPEIHAGNVESFDDESSLLSSGMTFFKPESIFMTAPFDQSTVDRLTNLSSDVNPLFGPALK